MNPGEADRKGRRGSPIRLFPGRFVVMTVILLALMSGTAFANPPFIIGENASASNGAVANISIATIGAVISYDLFITADSNPLGLVQLWNDGPVASMSWIGAPPFYALSASYTVPEGIQNGLLSPVRYTVVASSSASSPVTITNTAGTILSHVLIDNMPPRPSGALGITVNGIAWTGGWVKKNDKLRFSQAMDTAAYQAPPTTSIPERASLDLRSLGGPESFTLTTANPHTSPTGVDFVASPGIDLALASITMMAEDPYGNILKKELAKVPVDTIEPIINSVLLNATSSKLFLTANQPVQVQLQVASFDNDIVIGSCTWLSPAPFTLVNTPGNPATYSVTLSVLPSIITSSAFTGDTRIEFTVTDKAGNQVATTTVLRINNITPIMEGQPLASLTQRLPISTDSIGIIGDEIAFTATTTFQPGQDGHLYIDLSPIGGPSQLEIPSSAVPSQYFLNWRLPRGIAEDTTPYAFNITARNINAGGNIVASWTTPAIFVDNLPPVIEQKTVTRISGTGSSYKIGDQIKVDVRVSNVLGAELGDVRVDVASLSSTYPGLTRLNRNPIDQTLFEGVFTVGSFTTPGMGWDGLQTLRIIASDSQGNLASDSVSTGLPVDNQFIGATIATYVCRPPTGGNANTYVRAGDWLEFRVTIATAQSDLNPITIDLSPFGLTGARTMVASTAPGLFTYTVNPVPVGVLQKATGTCLVSISDNDGNATTVPIDVPIDTALPVISNVQITCPRVTRILFNDPVEVTADVTHVLPGNGTVTVNLSRFGLATESVMEYLGGTTWRRAFNATSSTPLDQTNFRFVVTASTTSYLVQATSSPILVDNDPVSILGTPLWSVLPALDANHPKIRIGDQLTLKIQVATPTKGILDGETTTIDLSTAGGSANQGMALDAVGTYTFSFILATGTLNDGATFPFLITDNDGNRFVSSISIPLLDNQPPATGPLTVQVGLQPGKQDSTAATVINTNKYIRMSMGYTPIVPTNDNATATIDLYLIGSGSSVILATSTGAYSLIATPTIQPVNVEASNYRFTTIVTDLSGNKVAIQSPPYTVDCHPARIITTNLTWNGLTNATAPIGSNIVFNVQIEDSEGQTPTVDLSPLNGPKEFPLLAHPSSPGWFTGTFTIPLGTVQGPASFTVTCLDDVQNVATASTNVLNIDQRPLPPAVENFAITISRTNNDNPSPGVANIDDEITVSADIQFWTTPVATLTYVQLATDSGIIIATGTLRATGTGNRYSTTFNVKRAADWIALNNATLSVYLRAQDISDNVTTRSASSSFAIDNLPPRFITYNWWVSPNIASVTAPDGLPVINVGSYAPIDLLWASASIDTPLYTSLLNLSQVPGAPASFAMRTSDANADLINGISIASYAAIDWRQATFTLTVRDLAGNATATSKGFWIDTRRPLLTDAWFDGATLTVRFDEAITAANGSEFEIWGSSTTGISTSTVLSTRILNGNSVVFPIDAASQTMMAAWASQSLFLKVKNDQILPAADLAGNWTPAQTAFPITMTSSLWREDPRIVNFLVTQIWTLPNPALIVDLVFSKPINKATLIASYAVLFVTPDDFTSINFRNGYVFQPADIASSLWVDSDTRLRITLTGESSDWLARKLGSGNSSLCFAVRAPTATFCRDKLNKPLQNIPVASPLIASVIRPYTDPPPLAFSIENAIGSAPTLDLASGTLRLWTSDRTLLYTNDYYAIDTVLPTMGVATPTVNKRITSFHGQLELHDVDASPATSAVLAFKGLDLASNPQAASMTMLLHLTDADRAAVLEMFRSNPNPNWRLKVRAGAFTNLWSQPNQLYFPSEPGGVIVTPPVIPVASQARLVACSISDPSPTRNAQPGQLSFEFEIQPAVIGNNPVPISLTAPTARIASGSTIGTGANLASGTFEGWSVRVVDGVTRYVARFTNTTSFPASLAEIASTVARLELFGVSDSLGNQLGGGAGSVATTTVWDLNLKDDLQVTGFRGATATLYLDLKSPVPVIPSTSPILRQAEARAASMTFAFDELMNRADSANPTMFLATSANGLPYTFPFVFDTWVSATEARFLNEMAVTQDLPQGTWTVQLSGFDLADNPLDTATLPVALIRTLGPQVESWVIHSQQATTASSTGEVLVNQSFSGVVAPNAATLSIRLAASPASTPLSLHFLNGASVTVASFPLTFGGVSNFDATFTWELASPAGSLLPTGTPLVTYGLRLVDPYGNANIETLSWTRDDNPPAVSLDKITGGVRGGPASQIYFNPSLHTAVTTTWTVNGESSTPLLRVIGNAGNATDTFLTTVSGTKWNGRWVGRREDNGILPDGDYRLDLVDAAGNVAVALSANPIIATVTLDTTTPVVATITSTVNGIARTRFAPSVASITLLLTTSETASPTGVWQVEIRTDAANNTLVATAPVAASGTGLLQAWWNGRRTNGTLVTEGYYRVYASDLAGNRTTTYLRIYVSTSEFRLISASQIGSTTLDLRFDREIDPTWPVATDGFVFNPDGPQVTSLAVGSTSIRLFLMPQPGNGQNTITVLTTHVRSSEGTFLSSGKNTVTIQLDTEGPRLTRVGFEGITTLNQFIAYFNERVNLSGTAPSDSFGLVRGTSAIAMTEATVRSDLTSILITTAANLTETATYTLAAFGTSDPLGNLSSADTSTVSFSGPDRTPPVFTIAAFSNPANEWDLMVAASSSETLLEPPTLEVTQSGGWMQSFTMSPGANSLTYMAGVHLDSRYPGNGTLAIVGQDQAGNTGTGTLTFATALVTASVRARIESPDRQFAGTFEPGTLRNDTLVKIIPQSLETALGDDQRRLSLVPAAQRMLAAHRSPVRASTTAAPANAASMTAQPLPSELVPLGKAYEISLKSSNLVKPFRIQAQMPAGCSGPGIGLFRHDETKGWIWSGAPTAEGWATADTLQPGLYALLRDTQPPRLSLTTAVPRDQVFRTDRPSFEGTLEEYGSGLVAETTVAVIDGIEQPVQIEAPGEGSSRFRFTPLAPLTGGDHDLQFQAADHTGNIGRSAALRFQVQVPLAIGEMMNFPNPVRGSRAVIRISANRADIREELLEVTVHDTAGHRVRWLDGVRPVREVAGASARYLYDVPWDLRNEDGRLVANGLYLVQVRLRDPDTGRTLKKTHKIAVLR